MQRDAFAAMFDVSRETLARLDIYEAMLRDWGQTLSLVGRATLDDVWDRHFADSAQILPLVKSKGPILDMGTGAGFPGMVLAIMGIENIHLSDNNQKKIEFLQAVAQATGTAVTIHNCKAEAVPNRNFGTITARALASLDELLGIAARFFGPATQGVFLKGKAHPAELEAAQQDWMFTAAITPSLTNADSAIIRITNLERRKAA